MATCGLKLSEGDDMPSWTRQDEAHLGADVGVGVERLMIGGNVSTKGNLVDVLTEPLSEARMLALARVTGVHEGPV